MTAQRDKRKLLMLGGSESQVVAIDRAKELGYFTVLCDYLPDNPGQHHADRFYQVSTTDLEAVLKVAKDEQIDGVVAYGSDPAAPTAAYVAEQLGLPGMPYETVRDFCEKHRFREFLRRHGFNSPDSIDIRIEEMGEARARAEVLSLPVVVKPTDSSGSKGVTVVNDWGAFGDALEYASKFSRNGVLEIEQCIIPCHPGALEAEIFVYGGKVVSWGLMNTLRDNEINPLLPSGSAYPMELDDEGLLLVRNEIERLITEGDIQAGPLNIEMLLTAEGELYFIDVGPRNGGNLLPVFFSLISGDDIVEGTIRVAMGDPWEHSQFDGTSNDGWYMHILHSRETGVFDHIEYSDCVKDAVVLEDIRVRPGDHVEPFTTADKSIGILIMHFPTRQQLNGMLADIDNNINVVLK